MVLHFRESAFWDAWDCDISDTSSFNSTSSKQLSEINTRITQPYPAHTASASVPSNVPNNRHTNKHFLSHEQIMDLLCDVAESDLTTQRQFDEGIHTVSNYVKISEDRVSKALE